VGNLSFNNNNNNNKGLGEPRGYFSFDSRGHVHMWGGRPTWRERFWQAVTKSGTLNSSALGISRWLGLRLASAFFSQVHIMIRSLLFVLFIGTLVTFSRVQHHIIIPHLVMASLFEAISLF
jgi:hypothetical protein